MSQRTSTSKEDSHISIPESFNTNQRQSDNEWNLSYYLSPPSYDSKGSIHSKVQKSIIFVKQMKRKDQELDISRKNAECLQQKVMELEFNFQQIEKDLSEKNNYIDQLNGQIEDLKLKAQFAENPQLSEIWQRGVWLEENNQNLMEQFQQASEELQSRGHFIQQSKLELQKLQESLTEQQKENKKLKLKLKKLKNTNKELKKIQQQNNEKDQDTELLRSDLKELLRDKIEFEINLKKIQENHKQEILTKEQEIFKLQEQLKKLQESLNQFELNTDVQILNQEKDNLLNLNNQLNYELQTLRKTFIENEGLSFGYDSKYLNNNLTYSRSFSQTSKNPLVPHINMNKLTTQTPALEMAEVFLQESKINSSRLNTLRVNTSQILTSRQVRSNSVLINSTEFMHKKIIEQLQFDLDSSIQRENLIQNMLNKLIQKYDRAIRTYTKECEQKLSFLAKSYEELEQYVKELQEENLASKSQKQLYTKAIQETIKQGRINKQIYLELSMIIKQQFKSEDLSNHQIEDIIIKLNQNQNMEEIQTLDNLIQKIQSEALKKQVISATQVATVRKSNLQEISYLQKPSGDQFNATGKLYNQTLQRTTYSQINLNNKNDDNIENIKKSLKQRAKEVLSKRLKELEIILIYVEQTLLGEVSDQTVHQLQKMYQKNPDLVEFAQKLGKMSFALRDQYKSQREQILRFMNQGVSIVLQNFKKNENIINKNPKLQGSLQQLMDQEWDYQTFQQNFDILWENLIIPNLQGKLKQNNNCFEECTVPEVKQLFQHTLSIAHGLAINLNNLQNSEDIRNIRNNLETLLPQQNQKIHNIQDIHNQMSQLIELLEELPESFFSSLLLQHKSVHFKIDEFFQNIEKIFVQKPQQMYDKQLDPIACQQNLSKLVNNNKFLIAFLIKSSGYSKNIQQMSNIGNNFITDIQDRLAKIKNQQDSDLKEELLASEQIIKLIIKLNEFVTE